jgi:hypothetical protein
LSFLLSYEANIAIEALFAGRLKVTDALLGDETFGVGLFPFLYGEAGGWVLTSKQLPAEKRSWKNDLLDYRKQTIELLFQRLIQSAELLVSKIILIAPGGAYQAVDCIQL